MANYLKTLSQISEPNLTVYDFDGMTQEIITLVKSDVNWNSIWDGELEQNASLMILEFFTFLFKKNSEYFGFNDRLGSYRIRAIFQCPPHKYGSINSK